MCLSVDYDTSWELKCRSIGRTSAKQLVSSCLVWAFTAARERVDRLDFRRQAFEVEIWEKSLRVFERVITVS